MVFVQRGGRRGQEHLRERRALPCHVPDRGSCLPAKGAREDHGLEVLKASPEELIIWSAKDDVNLADGSPDETNGREERVVAREETTSMRIERERSE